MNVEKALRALRENGFDARWFATAAEAADALCAELKGKTIGIGGSVTVEQLGVYDRLSRENTVYWHWCQPAAEAIRQAEQSQVYLLSANAVSETGALVNIDGTGNRVAASLYGREHVIYLVGVNKLAPTLEAAIDRARNVAAPLNARRLHCHVRLVPGESLHCHQAEAPGLHDFQRLYRLSRYPPHSQKAIFGG